MTTTVRVRTLLVCAVALMLGGELSAQTQYEAVHTFSGNKGGPVGALTEGSDARLYGTTKAGGFFGKGSVYVTDGAGTVTTIHDFDGSDGEAPRGQLLRASDGALYGTTSGGGAGFGTIFRISEGGAFAVVASFDLTGGAFPQAGLVEANGHLYGTTLAGGPTNNGTVFRLTMGGGLATLVSFNGANGSFPSGALIQATDGSLYGSTRGGGASGHGTIFRLDITAGGTPTINTVHSFSQSDGAIPTSGPMQASDGHLYGTTSRGGDPACSSGCGTLYRLALDGAEPVLSTLVSFSGENGELPTGALRELSDGIYGTTELGGVEGAGTIYRLSLDETFSSVASLSFENGAFPASGVIQTASGAIYGTSESAGPGGYGTVFELMPDGTVRLALSFTGAVGADPSSRLTQGGDGNFYGTTVSGGQYGLGTVFRATAGGDVTTIASFTPDTGSFPSGALLQASDGDLYGTTEAGGDDGSGTIFRLTTAGSLTVWASFSFSDHGTTPLGGLTEGSDGYLYGTLLFGPGDAPGAVFRVNKANGSTDAQGAIELVAAFAGDESQGSFPTSGVTEAPDGSFYGTAEMGGEFGAGTIFRVADLAVSTAVSFSDVDGSYPASRLLLGADGNFYGTTSMGGDTGDGTLFRLALDGSHTLTPLASFDLANGSFPYQQGVIQVGDSFYGTTMFGGDAGLGTVYRWSADTGITVLHSMDGITGERPNTALIEALDGSIYGTAIGPQGGVIFRMAADAEVQAVIDVTPATAIYGGSTTLSATLSASGSPIEGAEIVFSLNGAAVGSATTGADGSAALPGVPVAGIDAGTYTGAVEASFAGGTGVLGATATGDLSIAQATPSIVVADATYVYDGQPHPASGTVTGVGGVALGPLTFTYNGAAAAPAEPGAYAVVASYAGSLNYEAASATALITIVAAPPGGGGLIAAYAFDERGGSIAGDASGNGHFGTIKQARWVSGGRFGGALDFDGLNDWVTVEDARALDSRDALTIEAWVRPRSLSGWNTILLKESRYGLAYSLYANDFYPMHPAGYVNVGGNDISVVDNTGLALNAWSHVAMTYDGTMLRLYINGDQAGTRALTGRIISTDGELRIGGNSVWGEFFDGLIDEIRIYNRALPASEIVRDMNLPIAHESVAPSVSIDSPATAATLTGTPLVSVSASDNFAVSSVQLRVNGVDVGEPQAAAPFTFTLDVANGTHVLTAVARDVAGNSRTSAPVTVTIANSVVADYRFNEGTGSTVIDASGRNNNGTMTGGVSRVNDATRGQVLSFNGSSGLVSVADSNSLDLRTTMTLEAWVRPTAVDGWRTVVLKEGDGLSYSLYANDPTGGSRPAGYVRIDNDDEAIRGNKRLAANVWAHLAMTYDGAMMRLFVNGEEVESRRQTGAAEVSSGKLRIGGNLVWGEWFRGQIDDVRIYDVAVGSAQIKADMKR